MHAHNGSVTPTHLRASCDGVLGFSLRGVASSCISVTVVTSCNYAVRAAPPDGSSCQIHRLPLSVVCANARFSVRRRSACESLPTPSPQVVDEALWTRHSKRRVRDAPRPLYADGTQAQHTTYGLLALPRSLESGVCQGKDAAAFVRSDASCVSLDLVMCVRMLTGLDAPWDMARHSASARSSSYFLFVVRSSEKEYKYFE